MRETLEQSTTARIGPGAKSGARVEACGVICIASVHRLRLTFFLCPSTRGLGKILKSSRGIHVTQEEVQVTLLDDVPWAAWINAFSFFALVMECQFKLGSVCCNADCTPWRYYYTTAHQLPEPREGCFRERGSPLPTTRRDGDKEEGRVRARLPSDSDPAWRSVRLSRKSCASLTDSLDRQAARPCCSSPGKSTRDSGLPTPSQRRR